MRATRYLTVSSRPGAITLPNKPALVPVPPFSIDFAHTGGLFNHRNDRRTADVQVTEDAYVAKRQALAQKIRASGAPLFALAGVENIDVLEALANEDLADVGYTIVHVEGPGLRGLDAAVLSLLPVIGEPSLHVLQDHANARGVLEATFDAGGVPLTLFVVDAPKGAERDAGTMVRALVAEKRAVDPGAEILVLGATAGPLRDELGPTFCEVGSPAVLATPGLIDESGLRIAGHEGSVSLERLDAQKTGVVIDRVPVDGNRAKSSAHEGRLIAPGVWLRGDVRAVRHRVGDAVPPHTDGAYAGVRGSDLIRAIRSTRNRPLVHTYYDARVALFSEIANEGGWVECVYTGKRIQTDTIPLSTIMNTEHTRPASRGLDDTNLYTDLHNLFPCDAYANTKRGNNPFGVVKAVLWEDGGSKLGYDVEGRLVFEPRDSHKGEVARALAYLTVHGVNPEPWQIPIFKAWNEEAVDDAERARNDAIAKVQGNRNPFIDEPALVSRLWS